MQYLFSVLDHQSAENIAPSGVLSITPNEDTRIKKFHSTSQTMNLLNMNIKVLIYPSSPEMLAEMNLDVPLIDDEPLIKL